MKGSSLIQKPNYDISSLPPPTSECTGLILIERNALSHLLNPKWLGRGKVPFFEDTPGNRSSGGGVGPVAQRIRARGYEPRCRGFESLLAHNRPQRDGPFPFGGRKIMIGRADPKLWNLGLVLLSKWNGPYFFFKVLNFTYSMPRQPAYFFVLRPVTLPQTGLGRIAEQVQVLVA